MSDYDVIDDLIALVRSECPGLATVEEAWFASPIDHFDSQTPACLIYLAEDAADEAETMRSVQRVTLSYGLWLVCSRDDFRAQRASIRKVLHGHMFSEQYDPLSYRGGQTTDIRGEYVWWREFWTVDTWLHS